MSQRRSRHASPGRHPVSRWNSTIPPTCRFKWGSVASTATSSTGPTGSVARGSAALLESGHGRQPVVHLERDQFLPGRPLEDASHPADPLVHERPAPVAGEHGGADGLQGERAELGGGRVAVEFPNDAVDELVLHHLMRRGAIGTAVVPGRVVEVGGKHLHDGDAGRIGDRRSRGGFQFQLEPGERGAGFRRVEPAGQQLLVPDAGDVGPDAPSAAALLVEEAGRGGVTACRHGAGSLRRSVERFHTSRRSEAAPGTPRGKQKLLRLKAFLPVGRAGIEPAT